MRWWRKVKVPILVGALFALALLRVLGLRPYLMPSASMAPSLDVETHAVGTPLAYGIPGPDGLLLRWGSPRDGDVIMMRAPAWVPRNAGTVWIKRVIAMPGDRVRIEDDVVIVNGVPRRQTDATKAEHVEVNDMGRTFRAPARSLMEDHGDGHHRILDDSTEKSWDWPNENAPPPSARGLSCTIDECTVDSGYLFVLGDNRDHSSDSRYWGGLPIDHVEGLVLFTWWPTVGWVR